MYKMILEYLKSYCNGRENARTKTEIMKDLSIDDERYFREAIHALRRMEIPVMSISKKPGGYFMPTCETEAKEAMEELRHRKIDLHVTSKYLHRALKKQFPD
jgi:hypothetical protein